MSDQIQELMDIPRDFFKDGTQFINRCTKRTDLLLSTSNHSHDTMREWRESFLGVERAHRNMLTLLIADRREFIKISQAVGVGFLVMGAVGYLVKLSEYPIGAGVSVTLLPRRIGLFGFALPSHVLSQRSIANASCQSTSPLIIYWLVAHKWWSLWVTWSD